jgi:cytoskeletal protein CcmA (bactofilin family)
MTISRAHFLSVLVVLAALMASGCRRGDPGTEAPRLLRLGDDLLGSGGSLVVTDSVPGDAMLAGGSLVFHGGTGGDYLGAGGEQEIGGRVAGNVRAAGGQVRITGTVGDNLTLAGGRLEVEAPAVVGGNAYLAGGQLRVMGTVEGALRVTGGEVWIDGPVGGAVTVQAGRLSIGPRARIAGDLTYRVSAQNVTIDPAARIDGAVAGLPPRWTREALFLLRLLWGLGFLVAGAAVIALLPRLAVASAEVVGRRPGFAAVLGLAWLILVPLAVLLLVLTFLGIPLALLLFALYLASLYLGRTVVALWLGHRLIGPRLPPGRGGLVLGFLFGGGLLFLLRLLPWLGALIVLIASLMGIGAVVAALRDRATPEVRAAE